MKDNNRSLFLYTGLIFLVALIIILISMFGQNKFNKDKSLPASAPSGWGLTEKVSLINEENRTLKEQTQNLEAEIAERDTQISALTAENASQAEIINNYNIILDCCILYRDTKYTEAKELLQTVNTAVLSQDMKMLYDELVKKVS